MYARLKTGTATLVQFILGAAFSFITGLTSIFLGCHTSSGVDCVTNTFVSLVVILLIVGVYGVLLAIGYLAQNRRDQRLALVLIAGEAVAGLIFIFDARHAPDLIDQAVNLVAFAAAAWVAFVAWRQFRAGSGRIVRKRQ